MAASYIILMKVSYKQLYIHIHYPCRRLTMLEGEHDLPSTSSFPTDYILLILLCLKSS